MSNRRRAVMVLSLLGVSVPSFWLGLAMILVFSLSLRWFPATGSGTVKQLVLPAFALGVASAGLVWVASHGPGFGPYWDSGGGGEVALYWDDRAARQLRLVARFGMPGTGAGA